MVELPSHDAPSERSPDSRPALAIVCNTLTPYRINLHKVLAHGIPELKLLTLVTHGGADFTWRMDLPPEIHVTGFARHGERADRGMLVAPRTDWKKGKELINFVERNGVAAVIFTGYGYPSHLRLIHHLSNRRIPFFLNNDLNIFNDQHTPAMRRAIKRVFFRWVSSRASGIMPMGTLGQAYFAKYGIRPEQMYLLPYTPDYEWFAERDAAEVASFVERFKLAPDRRRLLFSGRFQPVKRVDLVIDAFVAIAAERPSWDLVLVGAGPLETELRDCVPAQLAHRVVWTGFLESAELRAAYHSCHALVLPSRVESWGVVVQEAMAAGLPVVASHVVGAAKDLVEEHISGRIFPSGDVVQFADALRDVTADDRWPAYRASASQSLEAWRRRVNVVEEVRRSLQDAGVKYS
jgi:glycosyltransferase involved in cell wall biosynthesis